MDKVNSDVNYEVMFFYLLGLMSGLGPEIRNMIKNDHILGPILKPTWIVKGQNEVHGKDC